MGTSKDILQDRISLANMQIAYLKEELYATIDYNASCKWVKDDAKRRIEEHLKQIEENFYKQEDTD